MRERRLSCPAFQIESGHLAADAEGGAPESAVEQKELIIMIHVGLYFPLFGEEYEVCLEEDLKIEDLIRIAAQLIQRKENLSEALCDEDLWLCSGSCRNCLEKERTLSDCGIRSGDRLILL